MDQGVRINKWSWNFAHMYVLNLNDIFLSPPSPWIGMAQLCPQERATHIFMCVCIHKGSTGEGTHIFMCVWICYNFVFILSLFLLPTLFSVYLTIDFFSTVFFSVTAWENYPANEEKLYHGPSATCLLPLLWNNSFWKEMDLQPMWKSPALSQVSIIIKKWDSMS